MRSVTPMKTAKTGYIILSALLCALGMTLILFPGFSASALGIVCGAVMILFGVVKLVGYFSRDLYRLAFQYDLACGCLLILLGLVMLLRPDSLLNFICVALGIYILTDGLFKIQISVDAKRFGLRGWWLILVEAILAALLGLTMIFRVTDSTRVLTVLLGVSMLAEGILNLSTVITAVKIIKHQQPDVIDAEFYENKESEE